jgi:hypothetical protein
MQQIYLFPTSMDENSCQLLYVLLNDVTIAFVNFGRFEILKQVLKELNLFPVRERIFLIDFNL